MFISTPIFSQLKYTSSGDLGIGTTTPAAQLDLNVTSSGKGLQLLCGNNDVTLSLRYMNSDNGFYWKYQGSGSGNLNDLELWTDGSTGTDKQVYNIHQDGYISFQQRVGINKTEPAYKLDVYTSTVQFDYNQRPLQFFLGAQDPRICSEHAVIFYNTAQNGFIDIQVDDCIEASDSTLKTEIRDVDTGLAVVKQLNGVTYLKKNELDGPRRSGLIAQDVEKVLPGVVFTNDSTGIKLISYTKIIPYLIEAIKDQQSQIEDLEAQVNSMSSPSPQYKAASTDPDPMSNNLDVSSELFQNTPNPFSNMTTIEYHLSEGTSSAIIYVYDMTGKQLRNFELMPNGSGEIIISGGELQAGMYTYAMIADGKLIGSKQMVLTNY